MTLGFIFDLDGTLLNSTDIGQIIQDKIMKKYNIEITEERKEELEALAESMFQEDYSDLLAVKIIWRLLKEVGLGFFQRVNSLLLAGKMYKKLIQELKLYDGVEEVLNFLEENAYRYVIVTNSSKKSVVRNMQNLNHFYERHKDKIITKDDVKQMKPHPESFELAQEILKLTNEKIVVVGDTKYDILYGKALNALTIGVLTGIYKREFLREYDPDFIFDSVADIPNNMEKILEKFNS